MKILRLQSENVKRVKAVAIEPNGAAVVIRGRNAQGKSSVLDSIEYALAGKNSHAKKVIREGAEQAHVVVELDDIIVERVWESDSRTKLEVRSREGKKFTSPQKLLDDLVGRLSFDPLEFMRQSPKQQLATLKELVGLDFSDLEERHKTLYDKRALYNKEARRIELNLAPADPAAPDAPVDVTELVAELELLNAKVREIVELDDRVADVRHAISERTERIERLEAQLVEERDRLADEQRRLEGLENDRAWLPDEKPDVAPIRAKIADAEAHNRQYREAEKWREEHASKLEAERKSEHLTKQMADLEAEKRRRIEGASFPIDGLALLDDGVTYRGLPLDQVAQSEQLRVSIAMGIALNPKLRVLLIREASFLDEEHLQVVADMAAVADAQVWLEVVGKDGVGVVIEDGEVENTPEGPRDRAMEVRQ